MRVVLYLRYSSDKQSEQSIEGQDRVCTDFCCRNNHEIVYKYIDRAISGKDAKKRLEFQRMITDAEKGVRKFDAVIVYKLDRFARSRYDAAMYKARLKKLGISVVSATENISSDPEGIILESVLEGLAEYYSMELAQKVTRGMRESAYKCNSTGGRVPFGYKIENKKYVIDPNTAPIVQEIFERVATDEPKTSIVNNLNERGIKTATGGKFTKSSLQTILQNKKYTGSYIYDDIVIENGLDKIIDEELFNMVQDKISKLQHRKTSVRTTYLLAGNIYCGICGERMTGEMGYSKDGTPHFYYTCSNRKRNHTCTKKNEPKEKLEDAIFEEIKELFTFDYINELAEVVVKTNDKINNELTDNKRTIEQLETTKQKIDNIIELFTQGIHTDSMVQKLQNLEIEKNELETKLEQSKHVIRLTKEQVLYYLEHFFTTSVRDDKFKQSVFHMLINKVEVFDDKFEITLNLDKNKQEKDSSTKDNLVNQTYQMSNTTKLVVIPQESGNIFKLIVTIKRA